MMKWFSDAESRWWAFGLQVKWGYCMLRTRQEGGEETENERELLKTIIYIFLNYNGIIRLQL